MRAQNRTEANEEWRKMATRARSIWDRYLGGNMDTLAGKLGEVANLGINAQTLGQNMRPRGRRPKEADKHISAFAKLFAVTLRAMRPDLTTEQLEQQFAAHIRTGAPSPLEERLGRGSASTGGGLAAALWSFDLWTPGQSSDAILRRFGPTLGQDGAQSTVELANDAIDAIGRGDFKRQRDIADGAISLGSSAPDTPLAGEGFYLKGEALRLMADFEPDRAEARRLRLEAEQYYGEAEQVLRGDPRPIRGRARIIEVMGDLDKAWLVFQEAMAAVDARSLKRGESDHLSLAHERVRTLRHKIACLAAMHEQAPLPTPEARRRADEIRRMIAESEPGHQEALKLFQDQGDWWRIEWFMAQVLHAKAWAAIDETIAAAKRLEWSLKLRLEMMPKEGPLSAVELGNLHWWSGVARCVPGSFEFEQQSALSVLLDAIKRGADRTTIQRLGVEFLHAGGAPWMRS